MTESTITELRRALSEMNEGVRALLGPESRVPELVCELLADDPVRPRGRWTRPPRRVARRHLALVK